MFSFVKSLKHLFLLAIIFSVISIGLIYVITLKVERSIYQSEVVHNIEGAIELQSTFIENWLEEKKATIGTLANTSVVKEYDKEKIFALLQTYKVNHRDFSDIAFVNQKGLIELSANTLTPAPMDVSDREYFFEAIEGRNFISDVIVGRSSLKPIITFSAPVFDYNKQFQGMVLGTVTLSTIESLMKQHQFGKTGETYIASSNGTIITVPRNAKDELKKVDETYFKKINSERFYRNYEGKEVIGTYKQINNNKWFIIGEMAKREIILPFYINSIYLLIVSGVVLFAAYYFINKLHKRIQPPLDYVLEGVDLIISGNYKMKFDHHFIKKSPLEFQKLCEKFNQMSQVLEKNIFQLEDSEARFRTLFSAANDAIIICDENLRITSWNQGAKEVFGFCETEMIGQSLYTIISKRYEHWSVAKIKRFLFLSNNDKASKHRQLYGTKKDGSEFPMELSINHWEVNGKTYFCGIIRDITKRKEQEKILFDSKKQFQAIFDYAGIGIVLGDINGNLIQVNRTFYQLLKYENDELIGKHFFDITHPDDNDNNMELINQLKCRLIDSYQMEKRYITKDGEIIWTRLTVSIINNNYGNEDHVVAIVEDITDKILSEQALKENEKFLCKVIQTIPSGIMIMDSNGKITFANDVVKELLFINDQLQSIDGTSVNEISSLLFSKVINYKEGLENAEMLIKHPLGEDMMISINAKPMFDSDQKITGMIASITDITERFKTEQKLKVANEVLKELSSVDGLTGVSNRRMWNEVLNKEWNRHLRNGRPLAILFIDIDYFKNYNDRYGHQKGDDCLKDVANAANEPLRRPGDFMCRYGGEEFTVILPETDKAGAMHIAEKIRQEIELLQIPHETSKVHSYVTVSIGVAVGYAKDYRTPTEMIKEADQALYAAKNEGRNRVKLYCKELNKK